MEIGEWRAWVKKEMAARNMSNVELSQASGISRYTVDVLLKGGGGSLQKRTRERLIVLFGNPPWQTLPSVITPHKPAPRGTLSLCESLREIGGYATIIEALEAAIGRELAAKGNTAHQEI